MIISLANNDNWNKIIIYYCNYTLIVVAALKLLCYSSIIRLVLFECSFTLKKIRRRSLFNRQKKFSLSSNLNHPHFNASIQNCLFSELNLNKVIIEFESHRVRFENYMFTLSSTHKRKNKVIFAVLWHGKVSTSY